MLAHANVQSDGACCPADRARTDWGTTAMRFMPQVMGDGAFVIRRDGECNFFSDAGCSVAPDSFELTPELEAERRMSTENRLHMIGARTAATAIEAHRCKHAPSVMRCLPIGSIMPCCHAAGPPS